MFSRLMQDPETSDIPVVMLTAVRRSMGMSFSAEAMKEFFGRGPAAYLEKPVDPDGLREVLRKTLEGDIIPWSWCRAFSAGSF
ncbi:MAG TPA: response regulator [Candidatus Latescibacteria bacterium]|nr:response regulator [Candidatus Latescibacterota bacterium]